VLPKLNCKPETEYYWHLTNYWIRNELDGQNGIKNPIIITTISWDASGVLVPATVDLKESLMAFLFKIAVILKYQI
jgi:hypothetical protein